MFSLKTRLVINKLILSTIKSNSKNAKCCVQQCSVTTAALSPAREKDASFQALLDKYEDKILYNCVIEKSKIKLGFRRNRALEDKLKRQHVNEIRRISAIEPYPIALRYNDEDTRSQDQKHIDDADANNAIVHFPYESYVTIKEFEREPCRATENTSDDVKDEIRARQAHYEPQDFSNWMASYENYPDSVANNESAEPASRVNYGTPDPSSAISNVPCGGCGALLHCKDTAIPGYIPSEIYKNYRTKEGQHLASMICQRCHFLKYYDFALQVRVSPESYPKVLEAIKPQLALVILMIDLLDFPCSIWPNIMDIIGSKRPVILVGNKVDLLPQDSKGYLDRIRQILRRSVQETSLGGANIKQVALISAKTGFGVEELITKLHNCWEYKGDVYLIGCTNVGKSTLFNALLQSDYCKLKAEDLIQRATTSQWPGTTLNLLKFPILRPSGWRLHVRTKRLISMNRIRVAENRLRKIQLQKTGNAKYATLIGHIGRTFEAEHDDEEKQDPFSVQGNSNASGRVRMGINERDRDFAWSKWCYDTPGVVQPDQVLHLLTTEELMLTLPKDLIRPRTFSIRPGTSVFLGGLGRLDFLEGPRSIRITVFASETLPVTICDLKDAEELYRNLVGTEMLQVPLGNEERMAKWPALEPSEVLKIDSFDWEVSAKDILLSSAGWISVTFGGKYVGSFQAWTPEKRGIHLREPLLPRAVQLRGQRIRFSPSYKTNNFFIK